jgi:phage terminase large subunit-like protein
MSVDADLFARVAEALDPTPADGAERWYCGNRQCDGKPHDGMPYRHARGNQYPPETAWFLWFLRCGRGFGKTRTGAEWLTEGMERNPGTYWALVAPTFDDGRDTMVEGESCLLFVLDRRKIRHVWNRSLGQLTISNDARLDLFTSQKPEGLRGPNLTGAWGDEPATWIYPVDTWDNLLLMCRKGNPQIVMTGTPQPSAFVKRLIAEADFVTTGSSYDNRDNLSDVWYNKVIKPLEGTRKGRQEIFGEMLEDIEGTLWVPGQIDACRQPVPKRFDRILVAVDPSVSAKRGDECGIMVGGRKGDQGYLLRDCSLQAAPERWAQVVVDAYSDYEADAVVGEVNNGGDLVRVNIHAKDRSLSFQEVTASRGKTTRAEPVAALYGDPTTPETWAGARLHHATGTDFAKLEDQMTTWVQGDRDSPDRMDAMVWLFTKLMGLESKRRRGRGGLRYRK